MSNERDTHFAGFANLLDEEIEAALENIAEFSFVPDAISDDIKHIIAQRAYDLAYHFVESAYEHRGTFRGEINASVQMLPDLTEWPTTEQALKPR